MAETKPQLNRDDAPASENPALSAASAVVALMGLFCGFKLSWIICVVAGIAAIALGVIAHRQHASMLWMAKAGIALGALGILLLVALVVVLAQQLSSLGIS